MNKPVKKTQQIINYLMELIQSKKIPTNKIMPSEHALMMRFNCSRSVVVAAYQKLEALGAIYSISKRGHFVAENFHNLIKPVSYLIGCDKQTVKLRTRNFELPEWIINNQIIFVNGVEKFQKEYFKKGELVAEGEIYISGRYVNPETEIQENKSLIDYLNNSDGLTNIVYRLNYEKVNKFNHEFLVVVSFYGYDEDSISIAGKYYIKPEYFTFYHQEFSLNH
ncbi:winged helix-turn-helix domain-containing protein [Mycoplasma anserisalpingitidis]|uniref:GntR family transcriptional regulator n=1 Tax=Mycoplasma anserisalpingitidis TaxID=519450 RepID=A0A5B8K550_9MOLU|nr:GntR family transcriptional regulator [Mycoplasma anserisalpingitidis]QDY88125.1 GntR family transcriptional regulator [Mycoplasma anserisalpingitidis]